MDWYQIKTYDLGEARTHHKISDFPEHGDCIVVLENENETLAKTYIRFNSPTAIRFDLYKHNKLRHYFHTLYLDNEASSGKLRLLIGKGNWRLERHYPQEQTASINADTVDYFHARSL